MCLDKVFLCMVNLSFEPELRPPRAGVPGHPRRSRADAKPLQEGCAPSRPYAERKDDVREMMSMAGLAKCGDIQVLDLSVPDALRMSNVCILI